jgi:parallel beta-helix repeat protein
LATFTVTSLHNAGAGSLRQAIVAANKQPGPDTIDFAVSGTIRVGKTSLPAITDTVTIDGSSAPTFAGTPVVTVDFRGTKGLRFANGSDGSTLRSLALVKAGNSGVTLDASHVTVQGNDIGLLANGKAAGNAGDGIRINASSTGDLIGQVNPVTGVSYYNADGVGMTVNGWQGIRDSSTPGQYLITGTANTTDGLLYEGPISGVGGTPYVVDYPKATSSSLYGPDLVGTGPNGREILRLVGSYKNGNGLVQGFAFQGTTADLLNPTDYRTIDYQMNGQPAEVTYVHSTAGDLAVGNGGDINATTDHAFLYSYSQDQILTDIVYPGSTTFSTTAYGIWHNGGTSYTICGGYTAPGANGRPLAQGYLVDYDSSTGQFSRWTSIAGPGALAGPSFATHFQGISSPEQGVYTLSANVTDATSGTQLQAELATVLRNPDGSFGPVYWVPINYPQATGMGTANSVADNQIVGIAGVGGSIISYQATVDLQAQTSNVIGGNRGNGIGIYGASDNRIAMNNIGTDVTGTLKRGNAKNGILVTQGASRNFIGGAVSGGNSPTQKVIVRPPQGNLISGNRGNGVLMTGGATGNTMSGNFVGTTASGDAALGNRQDGVAIVRANGNQLIGCTVQDQPFVYYNVLSGNGGNGLRITNSSGTTVHANFLGAGANNTSIVANRGDGLLVSGHSSNTQVGGVIPLGNVISGNDRNGIEVTQKASGFTSFNTFAGTFAFGGAAPNRRDGTLITSGGGNNLIRTCIIAGNGGNGIELGGHATGVQVTETAVGTSSNIQSAIPNGGDGIKIDDHAHGNAIGGFQPSIEPQVTVSGNRGYGIAIAGSAWDNKVFHTVIGTNGQGTAPLGNAMGGIAIGPGTSATTIGGSASPLQTTIQANGGPGVSIRSSRGNVVLGNAISGNAGDGVRLVRARKTTIGGNSPGAGSQAAAGQGNRIVINQGYGLYALGRCSGSLVQGNTIAANTQGNVNLTHSRGITYIPT